jgi:hypothetical protein
MTGGMKDGFPVSVSELLAAGQRPLPSEAVAIVLDVCRQVMQRQAGPSVLPPISTAALFLDGSGAVSVAGGVPAEDDQTVPLLARVLLQMLPPRGTPGAARVPSRLRLLAAHAAAGDPPRADVGRFSGALLRFGPQRRETAIRAVFRRWSGEGPRNPDLASRWGLETRTADGAAPVQPAERRVTAKRPGLPVRVLRGARRHSLAVGVVVVALVVLAGIGARYWLNAKEILPPLPVNPAILLREPPAPARNGWELLSDPARLAVDADSTLPLPTDSPVATTNGPMLEKRDVRGQAKAHSPLDAPFVHRPDQRP